MFWESLKAKGKLRLCSILALCAVLIGCAAFAFSNLFGGNENGKSVGNGNTIVANAADTPTASVSYTISGTAAQMETQWVAAVKRSVDTKSTVKIILGSNWTAAPNESYKTAFGTTSDYFECGQILIDTDMSLILDLNGYTLSRGLTIDTVYDNGRIFFVRGSGSLTIEDSSVAKTGIITGGVIYSGSGSSKDGGAIRITEDGTVTLNSGTITGCRARSGSAVNTIENGHFIMNGGYITDNIGGGAVGVYGKFTMTGGVISGTKGSGGYGVHPDNSSITNITGGSIVNNAGHGFATWCPDTFNISHATISGNGGDGIHTNGAVDTMNVNIKDCNITSNAGMGLHVIYPAHYNLSGSVKISNNGGGNIVLMSADARVYATGKLTSGSYIGVTGYESSPTTQPFLTGYTAVGNTSAEVARYFFADNKTYKINLNADGTLQLGTGGATTTLAGTWSSKVTASLNASGAQQTFDLTANWKAVEHTTFGSSFNGATDNITTNTGAFCKGALCVPAGANILLKLNGYTIDRALTNEQGTGAVVVVLGTLTIQDSTNGGGTIMGAYNSGGGGGIAIQNSGKVTLQSGTIACNTALNGAGVTVSASGSFTMTGGTIKNNIATANGGGVYNSGTFTMSGGTITQNTATYTTGSTGFGGGVYQSGTFNASNTAKVTENYTTTAVATSNVYLPSGKLININGTINSGFIFGITMAAKTGTVTSGFGTNNSSKDPATYFTSDNDSYTVSSSGSGTSKQVVLSLLIATPSTPAGLVYNGASQEIIHNYNTQYIQSYTVTATYETGTTKSITVTTPTLDNMTISAKDAADYKITFKLKSGYSWKATNNSSDITVTAIIAKKAITSITGVSVKAKEYNGNTTATLSDTSLAQTGNGLTFVGIQGSDKLAINTYTATFADKTVATGKTVTISNITLKSGDTNTKVTNYSLASTVNAYSTGTTKATANITKKAITAITGITVNNKIYDGGIAATLNKKTSAGGVTFTGMVDGDSLEISSATTLTFADKNVATGKTVTVSGITLGGKDANNYSIASTVNAYSTGTTKATANITKKALTAASTISNKEYDGDNVAGVTTGAITGIVSGDDVTVASSATFADKNVGAGKTTTIKYTLTGNDAGNYSMADRTDVTANITAKAITSIEGITVNNKEYNGNTTATLSTTSLAHTGHGLTFNGMVDGDVFYIGTYTATFADKNVGAGKTVTVTVTALGGTDAGNYNIGAGVPAYNSGTDNATANITQKEITAISSMQAGAVSNKTYDGDEFGTLSGTAITFTSDDLVSGDTVTISAAGDIAFSDKNVATGKTVTVKDITLGGTDGGNYSIADTVAGTTTADITKKAISAVTLNSTGVVNDKTYDGTANGTFVNDAATGTAFTSTDVVSGDTVFIESASSILFGDENAADSKTVTVSGITLGGTDGGNYSIAASVEGTTTATIEQFDIGGAAAVGSGSAVNPLDDVTYTGGEHRLLPTVIAKLTSSNNFTLVNDTDYELSYDNSVFGDDNVTGAGVVTVYIDGKGNFTGTTSVSFTINKATISSVRWNNTTGTISYPYDGDEHKPVITNVITTNNGDLVSGAIPSTVSDMFTYSYTLAGETAESDCKNAGSYEAVATLQGDYAKNFEFSGKTVSTKKAFAIAMATITLVVAAAYVDTYDRRAHGAFTDIEATVIGGTAENNNNNLTYWYWNGTGSSTADWKNVADGDWTEDMPEFTDAGTYTVFYKITADNHTTIGGLRSVTIKKKDISGAYNASSGTLDGSILPTKLSDKPYTGNAYTEHTDLFVKIMLSDTEEYTLEYSDTLKEYTATFKNNIKAGTATITIKGDGKNYTGTRTITFKITKADMTDITLTPYSGIYDGEAHDVILEDSFDVTLVNGDDDDTNEATWQFRIDGTSAWLTMPQLKDATPEAGTKIFYKITAPNHNEISGAEYYEIVKIAQKDISADYMLNGGSALADETYTGNAITPVFTVEQNLNGDGATWTELVDKTDFDFSYSDNTDVGEATVTVTGKGNYKGTNTIKFNIVAANGITASAQGYQKQYDGIYHDAVHMQTASALGGNEVAWWYSTEDISATDTGWSANVPQVKDVGDSGKYYFKVTADNNAPFLGEVEVKITPIVVTSVSDIAADGKVYDGTNNYGGAKKPNVSDGEDDAASVHLENAVISGYIENIEKLDDGNKSTVTGDLKLVWAEGLTDAQKGTFGGVNRGSYTVTIPFGSLALGGAEAGNYDLQLTQNIKIENVQISARVVEVEWEGLTQNWDNNKVLRPGATITNLVGSDAVTVILKITQNGTEVSPSQLGDYNVAIVGLNGDTDGNYTLIGAKDLSKTFTITTTSTVVYWNTDGLVYDGTAKKPAIYFVNESGENETLTKAQLAQDTDFIIKKGDVVVSEAIEAGTYTISLTLNVAHVWSDDLNGTDRSKTITFTIEKAEVTDIGLVPVNGNDKEEYKEGSEFAYRVDWSNAKLNGTLLGDLPDEVKAAILNADGSIKGVTPTIYYDGVASAGVSKVGTYSISAKFAVSGNFKAIDEIKDISFEIEKAHIELTDVAFEDENKTVNYTGSAFKNEIVSELHEKISVSYTYVNEAGETFGAGGVTAVGVYTVTATFTFRNAADKDNYKLILNGAEQNTLTATLTVNKQAAEVGDVKFESASYEYDGNVHRLLVSGAATGVKSVSYEYATDAAFANVISTDGVKDVGKYYVRATFTVDGNYSPVDPITKTLEITKATLTVKADNKTVIYGEDPNTAAYTATFSGLRGGDTAEMLGTLIFKVTGYSIYGNAGIYQNVISVSGLNTANYTVKYETGDLTVKPREIEVKWYNDGTKNAQDLTYNYTGATFTPYADVINAVHGDSVTVTVVGGQSAAGMNYEAKATAVSNSNYTLPVSGLTVNFSIIPQPKEGVVFWDYTPLYYNGREQRPKAYYFENESDNSPKELTVTVNKTAKNAGKYTATAVLNGNYYTYEFEILKREVYIVIGDYTTGYAGTVDLSGVTWTYAEGSLEFVAGDNYTITFSCGAVSAKGTYPISATFASSNANNYNVHFSGSWSKAGDTENNGKKGTLTVTEAKYDMSKVTFSGTDVTYDGNTHEIGVNNLPTGVKVASVNYLLDGWALGNGGVIDAGTYTVIISFTGAVGFEAIPDMEVTLTVKKAALTVKANDVTITYGEDLTDNGVTYLIDGVEYQLTDGKLAGQLNGTLKVNVEEGYTGNAGKYKLTPAGLTSDNYEIVPVPGNLTVNPREVSVKWYSDSTTSSTVLDYDFDGQTHQPYPVASGMLGTDKVTFTVSGGTSVAGLSYTAKITAVSNSNYKVKAGQDSVEFNVIQKGVVIWDNTALVYDGTNQKPAAKYYDEADQELKTLNVAVRAPYATDHANAGIEYTAYVTDAPEGITASDYTYKIAPKPVTIAIGTAADLTYGKVEANLEATLQALVDAMSFDGDKSKIELTCNVNNSSNVGAYTITGVCTDGNYDVTFTAGSLAIVKDDVGSLTDALATFADKTVTYNGKVQTITVDETKLPYGVTGVTYEYYQGGVKINANRVVNAGAYTVKAYFAADGNHNDITTVYEAELTIDKATISLEWTDASYSFKYDGKAHSVQVKGDLAGVKSVTYFYNEVETDSVKAAGAYAVRAEIELVDSVNYEAVDLGVVTLVITKASLTVTADDVSVVYGTAPKAEDFGYTVEGLAPADAADLEAIIGTVTYGYGTITKSGEYTITIEGGETSSDNYDITYKTGKLIVTPFVLASSNVEWKDKDGNPATDGKFVYTYKAGTVQQPYAYAVSLIGSDEITFVVEGGQINAGYGYEATIVRIEGKNAANYMLPVDGLKVTFDIIPAIKTGTIIWDNSPLYYNGTNLKPAAYYFLEEDGERIALTVTVEGDSKNVGTKYTATVSTEGLDVELSGDKTKEFEVLARSVYITIGDMEVQYGDTPNMGAVTWKYSYPDDATKQFLAGEGFTLTFNCGEVSGVGSYPISAQLECANAGNYEVVFLGSWASTGADNGKYGTLKVIKASYDMSKVTFVGTEVTFDGKNHVISVIGLPEGVSIDTITYAKDGFTYGMAGVKNAGAYKVTVKFKGDDSYGELDDMETTLIIKKAALTIKANDKTITYGEYPADNGVTYSGFAKDESGNEVNDLMGVLSYSFGYAFGESVGEYDIIIDETSFTSENYVITYKLGTLTVAPRTITVTWYDDETVSSQNFVYDYIEDVYHVPYAVAGNLVAGDKLTLVVNGANKMPGFNYIASVEELTNPNYKLPKDESTKQTYSILPAPARSIVWDNKPIYYNGLNLKPTAYYVEDDGTWTEIPADQILVYQGGRQVTSYSKAGTYTASVVYKNVSSSQAYEILPISVTIIIGNAEIEYGQSFTASAISWTYGGEGYKFLDETNAPITFICNTYTVGSPVGKYEISGVRTDDNYDITFVSGTLTVKKANYDMSGIAFSDMNVEYDGADHRITITGVPAGVTATVSYVNTVNGKTYGNSGVREAGEYKVTVTFTIDDTVNYETIDEMTLAQHMIVSKKQASVADVVFDGAEKTVTYNGDVQTMLASGTAKGVKSIKYTYYEEDGVTEVEGGAINAGAYKVKAEFVFDDNYDGTGITAQWATLIIEQAALTVTANDGSAVYGDTADANGYGYTVSGLIGTDSEEDIIGTVTFSYGTYTNAGKYDDAIEISGNTTADNYKITYVFGTLTVTPREITVTWYDEENGTAGTSFEYEYEEGKYFIPFAEAGNLIGGDTLVLNVAVKKEEAGDNYVATVQPLDNGNYTLPVNITANFTVKYNDEDAKKHEFELVWNNNAIYYNGTAQAPTARYYDGENEEWVYLSNVNDYIVTDKDGNEVQAIGVGEYTAKYDGENAETLKNLEFNFTIVARKVYIVIGDMQIKFGQTPDMSKVSWTYAYGDADKQFVSGDSYTLKFSVGEIIQAKKYPIAGDSNVGNENYEVVFVNGSWKTDGADNGACGTLTVSKATYDMSRVTFSNTNVTYDGTTQRIDEDVKGLPAGVTVKSVTYTRGSWSFDGGVVNAGTYTVIVSFEGDADNYEAIADRVVTMTVKKATLTVTANDSTIIYGEAPVGAGVTYAGLADSDKDADGQPKAGVFGGALVYEFNYLKRGAVGNYNLTAKGLISENYTITYVSGTLRVEKRTITVLWYNDERMNSQTLKYNIDGNSHLPYAEAGNLVPGDSVVLTVSGAQTAAGLSYVATIVEISNSNYKLPEGGTTVYFDIIPQAYVVVWESMPFVYNGQPQEPKAYYFTANGEQVSLRVTIEERDHANAGTYHARASLMSGSVAVSGLEVPYVYTIAPREITIVIKDGLHSAYGEDINIAGTEWWSYAEGSLQFIGNAPIAPKYTVTKNSPVGKYEITLVNNDTVNYVVHFETGVYTVEKAVVYAPELLGKYYTGGVLKADVASNTIFTVVPYTGWVEAGPHTITLLLNDYNNYRWSDTNSLYYFIEFVIYQAENEWTVELAIDTVNAGSGVINKTVPEAKFGNNADVVIKYYRDAACCEEVTEDYIRQRAPQGTYYAKAFLAGNDNYTALESEVFGFRVEGSLIAEILWENTTLTYNGEAQAPQAYVIAGGEKVLLQVITEAQTDAGIYTAMTNRKPVDESIDIDVYELTGTGITQYTVVAKGLSLNWNVTDFTYDGTAHLPEGTLSVGDEEFDLSDFVIGEAKEIILANGDVLNVTFGILDNGNTVHAGSYSLRVAVDNKNYAIAADEDEVEVSIAKKEVAINWSVTNFKYDGNTHLPEGKIVIGDEEFELSRFTLGEATEIELANGDKFNVTIRMPVPSDMTTEGYMLFVSITGNDNYELNSEAEFVDISIEGYKEPIEFKLPLWTLLTIAGALILMIFIIVMLIARRNKQPEFAAEAMEDLDGFNDVYDEDEE